MNPALIIEAKDLRQGIADRLNLMRQDARKGEGRMVSILGDTVEAELRRLITPFRGHTGQRQERPAAAIQMGLSVTDLREIRILVLHARTVFMPENRKPAVAFLNRALAQWRGV